MGVARIGMSDGRAEEIAGFVIDREAAIRIQTVDEEPKFDHSFETLDLYRRCSFDVRRFNFCPEDTVKIIRSLVESAFNILDIDEATRARVFGVLGEILVTDCKMEAKSVDFADQLGGMQERDVYKVELFGNFVYGTYVGDVDGENVFEFDPAFIGRGDRKIGLNYPNEGKCIGCTKTGKLAYEDEAGKRFIIA